MVDFFSITFGRIFGMTQTPNAKTSILKKMKPKEKSYFIPNIGLWFEIFCKSRSQFPSSDGPFLLFIYSNNCGCP